MQRAYTVSWHRLAPLEAVYLSDLRRYFLSSSYNDATGFGFREVSLVDARLAATLVRRTSTLIPQLDVSTGALVEQEIYLYSETEFSVDCDFELLEVVGPARGVPKVLAVLNAGLPSSVTSGAVSLAPVVVIPRLTDSGAHVMVDRLTVNNFQHREGITGRYEMRIAASALASDILDRYAHDVARSKLTVSWPDVGDFGLNISAGGSLTVVASEAALDGILWALKAAVLDGKG